MASSSSVSIGDALVRVQGQERYRALTRRLRDAGRKDLQRQLSKAIRREGAPALADVKRAWMTVDVTPPQGSAGKSTGLRARVSAATRIAILQRGIRIQVAGKKVDPRYGKSLAYYLNAMPQRRGWRHPVFGRRANPQDWQEQRGEEVFLKTLRRHEEPWRSGIRRVMDDFAQRIEG
jgi:hypothetical protein